MAVNSLGTQRFTLKPEHITLLRRMTVHWQATEYGAPEIDPKRPYGNSSVVYDLAEIFHGKAAFNRDHDLVLDQGEVDRLETLHRETDKALQVVLATGSFVPGVYEATKYMRDWHLIATTA